jgi:hypothetical protein
MEVWRHGFYIYSCVAKKENLNNTKFLLHKNGKITKFWKQFSLLHVKDDMINVLLTRVKMLLFEKLNEYMYHV